MPPLRERLPGLRSGYAVFMAAFVAAVPAPPPVDINAWAAEHRYVAAESGSPAPGKWDPELVPYVREIQACLSPLHPATDVTIKKSGQGGASECGLNLFGATAHLAPAPMLIVLPTVDEAKKYNKIKLQPTIEATPALARSVLEVKSRDEDSSTALFKRFRGGYAVITGANSSAGLQMVSAKTIIFEEVSEYPPEAGDRGDPIEQALIRGDAWEKKRPKRAYISTPALEGACRISAKYAASDQRQLYCPCPHCGSYQILRFDRLRWNSDTAPHGAHYVCAAHGCVIEAWHQRAMVAQAVWLKTYAGDDANPAPPETIAAEDLPRWVAARGHESPAVGRQPGFHFWRIHSPFNAWDKIVARWLEAQSRGHTATKVFVQQVRAEAWAERGDAPLPEKLVAARLAAKPRTVPHGALFLTGMADVQGDRLEWGVYAWSALLAQGWLIDKGVIAGDPATPAPWSELRAVIDRGYPDALGRDWAVDAFGIDAGYLSQQVYAFVMRQQPDSAGARAVFALDGRPGWRLPAIGTPATRDVDYDGKKIGGVLLWPVGTFDLKAEIYAGLRAFIRGPDADGRWPAGVLLYDETCDLAYFEQLTAERLVDRRHRNGVVSKEWVIGAQRRNEALDIAVGARALAHHLADGLSAQDWLNLAARRLSAPEAAQLDLARLWAPGLGGAGARSAEPAAAPGPAPAPKETRTAFAGAAKTDWLGGRGRNWFG